jgi:hypothetical protein
MKKVIVIASLFFSFFGAWGQGFLVETPEMLVFYEGIPIELKSWATGDYKKVNMSVPSPYTAAQGSAGSEIAVSLSGIDKKGVTVSLGTKKFLVKKAPKPELVWGGVEDGGRANRSTSSLACRYGNDVPFSPSKGKFEILSYSIAIVGVKGSLDGLGSEISASHLSILKSLEGDGRITITVKYTGSGNGIVSSSFQL